MGLFTKAKQPGRVAALGSQCRREQVLDAALAITVEHGVAAATFGAISTRLNVTRPVVYACFADRGEVITALLEREAAYLHDAFAGSLYADRRDSPEAAFINGYQSLLRVVEARPQSWRFIFWANPDPLVAGELTRVRARIGDVVSARLRPELTARWSMVDAEAKLPVVVELLMASSEAAVRSLLDTANTWTADELGELYGRMMCGAVSVA
jgi:AcrR family transcriptional regulator